MANDLTTKGQELRRRLTEPFGLDEIEWRVQRSGMTKPQEGKPSAPWAIVTPFIKARSIAERLDMLVGPARWRVEYTPVPGGGMLAGLALFLELPGGADAPTWQWVTKWDGTGHMEGGGERGLSTADAGKGEISTAFKRAAAAWGIGRYLGQVPEMFAVIAGEGRYRASIKINKQGDKQTFRWNPPALPMWALPNRGESGDEGDAGREQRAGRAVASQARRSAHA